MVIFDRSELTELTDPSQLSIGTKVVSNVWLNTSTGYGYYEMTSDWDDDGLIAMTYRAPDGTTFNAFFGKSSCLRNSGLWWYVVNEEMPYDPNGEGETDTDI